jgi:hypothetical protein
VGVFGWTIELEQHRVCGVVQDDNCCQYVGHCTIMEVGGELPVTLIRVAGVRFGRPGIVPEFEVGDSLLELVSACDGSELSAGKSTIGTYGPIRLPFPPTPVYTAVL